MSHRRFVAAPLDHLHPLSQQRRDAGDALWPSVANSLRTGPKLSSAPLSKPTGRGPRRSAKPRRVDGDGRSGADAPLSSPHIATGTRSPTQQPSGQPRRPPRRGSTEPAPRSLSGCMSHAGDENG